MSDNLFEIPESKSPRLLWLEKHGFLTHEFQPGEHFMGVPWTGAVAALPTATGERFHTALEAVGRSVCVGESSIGTGETVEDAIIDLCRKESIPLWNEA
jgi:hypothetical protein